MVQYYYDKYTAITNATYKDDAPWELVGDNSVVFGNWRTSYDFITSNSYSPGPTYFTGPVFVGSIAYAAVGTYVERYTAIYTVPNSSTDLVLAQIHKKVITKNSLLSATYNKGALVQSNIPAEDGTYPTNGRHTDGYWYVKGAAVGPLPPGTVINQPYSSAGNGGRKLVRLSNGTLMSAVKSSDNRLYIYKSTDNGSTWANVLSQSIGATFDIAAVARGEEMLVVLTLPTGINFKVCDVNGWKTSEIAVERNQTAVGNVSLAIDPTNGHLHAVWASKNVSYPNCWNLRYSKSTDEGVTWSAVEQVTNYNQGADYNVTTPAIVIRNGYPLIVATHGYGSTSRNILAFTTAFADKAYSNVHSNWGNQVVISGGAVVQNFPSVIVDKDGIMHVAWHTGPYGSMYRIMYSVSTNGGKTWEAPTILVSTPLDIRNTSITTDKNNKVSVVYQEILADPTNQYDLKVASKASGGSWVFANITKTNGSGSPNEIDASTLYDATFSIQFGEVPPMVYMEQGKTVRYTGTFTTNVAPTIAITSPTNNQTLYENDTLNISGDAYDADKDQSVTVYYQINSEARKVLATNLSQTQISLSKQLTFKGGKIYDGETALTGILADGVAHTLKVWAEDSEKASSAIVERTFYVVPNRAPLLTVDAVVPSGVVDADKFKISGTASDQDANSTVKVTRRINAGNAVEFYSGAGGAWEFEITLSQLVVGQNTIVIEVIDNYGAKTSKTVTLNKKATKTPILQSVARYKIEPPKGSAKGVLLFIQRDEELDMKVELSMTLNGEQEQYETLTPANTAPVQQGVVEDTFEYEGLEAKQNIILKITPSRTDLSFNHKIHLISGAVD